MSSELAPRSADPADAERVRELVGSSMTASYALSPEEIETILDAAFDAADLPETVTVDGETRYLGGETLAGSDGPFTPTFADESRSERYGYYCGNCGSADVSMDDMERLRCADCGNTRTPDENYDGAYL